MKKALISIIVFAFLIFTFASCGSSDDSQPASSQAEPTSKKIQIVTTVFPVYDWLKNIAGDNADVTMLLDSGVDLHNFQPTADDIIKIGSCDLFVYVGGESDEWVGDALKNAQNKNITSINLLELLGDKAVTEEVKDGMQESEDEEEEEEHETELDEHVWLSLKNASLLCSSIAEVLKKTDSKNAQSYDENFEAFDKKLSELDSEYSAAVKNGKTKTLLFADRFPFRYLTHDYSLDYYAAFSGCSAETEASFETVAFLASKVDELSLKCVLTIEGSDGKIAKTVIENTKDKNQSIVSLNSMQSTTKKDVDAGASYLEIMQNNLSALKKALA